MANQTSKGPVALLTRRWAVAVYFVSKSLGVGVEDLGLAGVAQHLVGSARQQRVRAATSKGPSWRERARRQLAYRRAAKDNMGSLPRLGALQELFQYIVGQVELHHRDGAGATLWGADEGVGGFIEGDGSDGERSHDCEVAVEHERLLVGASRARW